MQIKKLYKYEREGGGITISPNKPEGEYIEMYRLIADEGKMLTDGVNICPCADVESVDGWEEIGGEAPEEIVPPGEISDTEALKIIMGGVEV